MFHDICASLAHLDMPKHVTCTFLHMVVLLLGPLETVLCPVWKTRKGRVPWDRSCEFSGPGRVHPGGGQRQVP